MSHTTLIVRSLAIGAVLAFAFAALRRKRSAAPRALRAEAKKPPASVASAPPVDPGPVVLPLAFWDAEVELETEVSSHSSGPEVPVFDEPYNSVTLEEASDWLARATEARELGEPDDPAEIAPDSWSMVSEASRIAAAGEPAPDSEATSRPA